MVGEKKYSVLAWVIIGGIGIFVLSALFFTIYTRGLVSRNLLLIGGGLGSASIIGLLAYFLLKKDKPFGIKESSIVPIPRAVVLLKQYFKENYGEDIKVDLRGAFETKNNLKDEHGAEYGKFMIFRGKARKVEIIYAPLNQGERMIYPMGRIVYSKYEKYLSPTEMKSISAGTTEDIFELLAKAKPELAYEIGQLKGKIDKKQEAINLYLAQAQQSPSTAQPQMQTNQSPVIGSDENG